MWRRTVFALGLILAVAAAGKDVARAAGVVLQNWPANLPFPIQGRRVEPKAQLKIPKPKIEAKTGFKPKILLPSDEQPKPGEKLPALGEEKFQLRPRVSMGQPSLNKSVVGIAFADEQGSLRVCSGLYLDALHILTAKHCTCHSNSYMVTNNREMKPDDPGWIHATLEPGLQAGALCHRLSDFDESEGNDIAILTLDSPLGREQSSLTDACYSLLANIELLDVWRKEKPTSVTIAGYGSTTPDGLAPGRAAEADIPINSSDCASRAARSLGCVAYREMILGLHPAGTFVSDSCPGDSGGPAYIMREGMMLPVGIVSRSVLTQSPNLCGSGGIYTLLGRTDVIAWLHKKLPDSSRSRCAPIAAEPLANGEANQGVAK